MQSLTGNRLEVLRLGGDTVRELGRLHFLMGKQEVAAGVHRDIYQALREKAIIQGTEASNGIEGIVIPVERYRPLMQNKFEPAERSEKLIIGYRDTLEFIHREHARLEITPETLRDLHRRIYARVGESAGEFRTENNRIVRDEGGAEHVVFEPPPHSRVNPLMKQLCEEYKRLHGQPTTDEFLLLAGFVLDFTCIHPFVDGNGRVSRLLTTLLAYKAGFEAVRYFSHEKVIGDTRSSYYYALTESSKGWVRGGNHRWEPWIGYITGVFIKVYEELGDRVAAAGSDKGFQGRRIREVIQDLPSHFTLRDIVDELPKAAHSTIQRILKELKEGSEIETVGAGPKAYYRKLSVIDR